MLAFLLLIILIFALSLITFLRWNIRYWAKRYVPGPTPNLLNGTFTKTAAGKCNLVEELHDIYLQYKTSHKCVGVYSARSPKLFIVDPKLAAQILTQNFSSFHDNESSQWTSSNVEQLRIISPFVSVGEDWKTRRSELAPALTNKRLRSFNSTFCDTTAKLVKHLNEHGKDQIIDANDLARKFTAEFIANYIWGIEAESFTGSALIQQMAKSIIEQSLKCVRYYGQTAFWPWLRKIKPVRFFPDSTDKFFMELAEEIVRKRSIEPSDRYDVINHLFHLNKRKQFTQTELAGHTTTVLIDGFETAAMLIAHCLLLLSRDERVQQKLRIELFTLNGEDFEFDKVNDLPYLDQCIQETLRLFPPLPTLFKLCTKPIELNIDDDSKLQLQNNDAVYISSYSFHRDAEFYENPEQFWPERFNEELGGIKKYQEMGVFLPFGNGPRICPGMKLGLIEAKMAVAATVKHFQISSSSCTRKDNKVAMDSFLLCIEGGIRLKFEKLTQ